MSRNGETGGLQGKRRARMPAASGPPDHGGDLTEARAHYGEPQEGWLDLSTGINPHAYPLPAVPERIWQTLPQPDAELALRTAAAEAYGAPGPDSVVPAPGTQALIQTLPRVLPADRVAILGPTYGEYAPAWRHAGAEVDEIDDLERASVRLEGAERPALIVCNPNNPDGRRLAPDRLRALGRSLARRDGLLVVDEAFADVAPELGLAGAVRQPGIVVLRSFGKFFGLAGLRLGFALAAPEIAEALARALGPWAVSGPALDIGRRALLDQGWIAATRTALAGQAARLETMLSEAGFEPVGGTPLFSLVRHSDAAGWHERFARRGIWVRRFDALPDRLRIGLPGPESDWRRLRLALSR